MELPIGPVEADGSARLRADVPLRVIIAFDQLTDEERRHVLGALERIEREGLSARGLDVTRLGGALPLYALRAAPTVVGIRQRLLRRMLGARACCTKTGSLPRY